MKSVQDKGADPIVEMVVDLQVGKERFRGRLMGTGVSDAIVEFPEPGGPVLPLGEKFPLAFVRGGPDRPLQATGRVVRRLESEESQRYHFNLATATNAAVRTIFNRRGALRIWPDPRQPVKVDVTTRGATRSVVGQLKDISTTGMGLLVPEDIEAGMFNLRACHISFQLPGSQQLELAAYIRHRALLPAGIVYGLEFDRETAGFEDTSEAIARWVRQREVEIIRSAQEGERE